jgi:hypothetical protein
MSELSGIWYEGITLKWNDPFFYIVKATGMSSLRTKLKFKVLAGLKTHF